MAEVRDPPLEIYVAQRLATAADDLVDAWIEEMRRSLGVRPSRFLPAEELRDHVPQMVRGVAHSFETPVESISPQVIEHIRLHGELRREQGFDIEEIVLEFEKLTRSVFNFFRTLVQEFPGDADPLDVADVSCRLGNAMAEITRITLATYRAQETDEKQDLASRLSEYARTLSHELKNPLNAATASAKMLQEGHLREDQVRNFTDLLVRSLDRMDGLISDIRELAFGEASRAEGRWIPLEQAVASVFEEVSEHARSKDVSLQVEGKLPSIHVDAGRVEIALMNLVANAVKYSDPDKKERWVRVGAHPSDEDTDDDGDEGHRWVIRVADNGLGIPQKLQDKIFRRHFRGHPDVAEGTGLGLAIAHSVVTQRGGVIDFESTEGEGTVFRVTIPEREEWPRKDEDSSRA